MSEASPLMPGGEAPQVEVKSSKTKPILITLLVLVVAAAITVGVVLGTRDTSLAKAVSTHSITEHLEELFTIAQTNGANSRAVRLNYNKSAEYVIQKLSEYSGCTVSTQHFVVPVHAELSTPEFRQVSPFSFTYQLNVDFRGMRYGGSGFHDVTGALFVPANAGCSVTDYDGMPEGAVALVTTGTCDIVYKALAAQERAAAGVLQANSASSAALSNTRVRIVDWKEGDPLVEIPVFSISYSVGQALLQTDPTPVLTLKANMSLTIDPTYNVVCDTEGAAASDNVIVVGAHLDSVPEGPGINDNGSGSMTVLEMARQYLRLKKADKAVNPVRFAFWAAEEIGLLGARHYVREAVKSGEIAKIAVYFNYDMLGSPNYVPQVHDAYAVGSNVTEATKRASSRVQAVLEAWFDEHELPHGLASMTGGSDYLPFIEAGVAASGLATGASALKTDKERETFGGLAEAAYDPCYHLYCDTVANINAESLRQCAQAASFALERLVMQADLRTYLTSD